MTVGWYVVRLLSLTPLMWVLGVFLLSACAHSRSFVRTTGVVGTCEGVCQHYVDCKKTGERHVFESCNEECENIYVDNGTTDTDSLHAIERLNCEETLSFIEGDSGREPGARAAAGR